MGNDNTSWKDCRHRRVHTASFLRRAMMGPLRKQSQRVKMSNTSHQTKTAVSITNNGDNEYNQFSFSSDQFIYTPKKVPNQRRFGLALLLSFIPQAYSSLSKGQVDRLSAVGFPLHLRNQELVLSYARGSS